MLFFLSFILIWRVILAENCILSNVSLKCISCKHLFYEQNYAKTLKLTISSESILKESDCLSKDLNFNHRKVLIQNKPCIDCQEFDAKYDSLGKAFEEESKISIKLKKKRKTKISLNFIDI